MNKLKKLYLDFNSKHKRLCEIARFVIVGGIATVIDYLVMGLVMYFFNPSIYPHFYNVWIGKAGNPSTIATVIGTGSGFCVSLIANYLLSVLFVYEEKGNSKTVKGVILFAVMSAGGLLLNMLGMWLGYDICKINEWITKILMTMIVMCYNYLTRKLLIFRKSPDAVGGNDNVKLVESEKPTDELQENESNHSESETGVSASEN